MKKKRTITSSIYTSKTKCSKEKYLKKLNEWPGPKDHKVKI